MMMRMPSSFEMLRVFLFWEKKKKKNGVKLKFYDNHTVYNLRTRIESSQVAVVRNERNKHDDHVLPPSVVVVVVWMTQKKERKNGSYTVPQNNTIYPKDNGVYGVSRFVKSVTQTNIPKDVSSLGSDTSIEP
eukprot:CAMPEP_0194229554 /NCGR_PEP_ID=MMETSP0156-20130528/43952_1 /TAXON_ID=33649 /ORGANISM="Thalassionema nitzschioides, Strain L26-B" /LENGTH=131 /DNA_ID=CAMNT_0038962107 /DNA_START=147 /DNA_END=542 /DNA_ORIENTATION=+